MSFAPPAVTEIEPLGILKEFNWIRDPPALLYLPRIRNLFN